MASPKSDTCLRIAEQIGLEAAAKGSNFVYSPLSIRTALSLATVGGKGPMLDQMLSFLGFETIADLNAAIGRILGLVRSTVDGPRLSLANGIWVHESTRLTPEFEEVAASVHKAITRSADFISHPAEVAKEVNAWVKDATDGMIKDLISKDDVTPLSRIILVNALYFKGIWTNSFEKADTQEREFYLLDGSTVRAPFMTQRQDQYISAFDGFKVLRLPYRRGGESNGFSMHIFLPDDRCGFSGLMERMTSEPNFIDAHVPQYKVKVGRFMIPKFKISYGFRASDVLQHLGLKLPFSPNAADFSGMVADLARGPNLYISDVIHKAAVEVDEEGTVAAAATALMITLCCYVPPVDFVADHPFVFVIREDHTGAVWFQGHVVNPLEKPV